MARLRRSTVTTSILSTLSVVVLGALVASCGGGGGGGGGGGTPPPVPALRPPVITSVHGTPTSLNGAAVVSVEVSASDPDGDALTYQWLLIVSPASVTIRSPQAAYSLVDIPGVNGSYVFRARVSDGAFTVDSSDHVVTVSGAPGGGGPGSALVVTTQDLRYDELGRLVEVRFEGGQRVVRYTYDDNGNLLTKEVQ